MTIRAEEEEETKLHIAARLNNTKLVRAALREGFHVDALGICGWTALHQAASCGYLEITIALLGNGANPNVQDSQKCTPLHLAARNGHLEVVRCLVRGGARFDLRNAEGKLAQDHADDECRAFLQRHRSEEVVKLAPSPIEDDRSLQKLYGHKSNQSPVLSKLRQSSPQWSESSQSSQESMTSSSSDSSGSSSALTLDGCHPGPGEIKVSFDFNKNRQSLVIHVEGIKDVKLPADHNMSHIYVKGYLVPDKHKATKRKTSLLKLERFGGEQSSSDSVTSWDSEEPGNRPGRRMSQRIASTLKRGTRSSQKKKGQDQWISTALQNNMVPVFRISTAFGETFSYDAVDLRKVNVETCKVLLTLCGRNRFTTQGQPIASLSLPLAGYAKMTTPEWYPLMYKIVLPSGYDVTEEQQSLRGSRSWEEKGGKFTGRSLAWNEPKMSMSMPNIELSASSATSQMVQRASVGGEGGFPTEGSKKYKKHSGAGKMLKKEFKMFQGKGNFRYKKNGAKQETEDVVDSFSVDIAERSSTIPGASRTGSDLNKTLRERRDMRDLPGNRRSLASNTDFNENAVTEIVCLDEEEPSSKPEPHSRPEPSSRPELEHRSSFARSLKYSRAFQQQTSTRRDAVLNDVDVEDFDDISDTPFTVNNLYGRKSGIACN